MTKPDHPMIRTRLASADLRSAWSEHADRWVAWARKPGHDSYWRFHREQFLELVPPPGIRTLDLGCGEGTTDTSAAVDRARRDRRRRVGDDARGGA